jgi:hypothetical protein
MKPGNIGLMHPEVKWCNFLMSKGSFLGSPQVVGVKGASLPTLLLDDAIVD